MVIKMSYGIQLFPLCIVDGRSIIGGGQTHAISGGTKQISSHLQRHVESALLLYHGEYLCLQSCSSAREQGQALSIRALLDMTRKLLLRKSDT